MSENNVENPQAASQVERLVRLDLSNADSVRAHYFERMCSRIDSIAIRNEMRHWERTEQYERSVLGKLSMACWSLLGLLLRRDARL